MSCGMALGKGQSLDEILVGRLAVTEGVATAPALKALAKKVGVDMPISTAMANILEGSEDIDSVITRLLARDYKSEIDN